MIQTLSDLKTVRFNEQADGVIILDQTLLPGKEAYLTLTTAEEIWDAIYKLKVRGAPAIGVAAAYGIYVCARRIDTAEKSVFVNEFRKIKEYLAGSRPTAVNLVAALNRMERKLGSAAFREMFRSITIDNGVEFADCAGMESSCRRSGARTHVYYCHPYSAYERGSNEAANRIIRRFLPKGTDFSSLTRQKVKEIEAWMNDYPREKLGWKSANRAIAEHARALSIDIQKL